MRADAAGAVGSPLAAFRQAAGLPGVAFLHGGGEARGVSWLAWDPRRRLDIDGRGRAWTDGEPLDSSLDPLEVIERFVDDHVRRGRTVIGALSYDLRRWTEPAGGGTPRGSLPTAVLLAYDSVARHDGATGTWSGAPPPRADESPVDRRARLVAASVNVSLERYRGLFDRLHEALVAGEVYQANLAIPFDATLVGHPTALFHALASRHPVPYGAYLDCGTFQILCNSPEALFCWKGASLETRPIKGTRPRAATALEDAATVADLRASAKERAEHVMIVDLERNDLGRVAVTGSVHVGELAAVASYPSLHHLESSVTARLRPGVGIAGILRAAFPGGSITGAPKIQAMRWIDALEAEPREFYTGSILIASPADGMTANVAIRCAVVRGDRLRYFAGGGIVVDSTAEAEYAECLLKARAIFEAGDARIETGRGAS